MGTLEHRHASIIQSATYRGILARVDSREALVPAGPRRLGALAVGRSRQLGGLDGPNLDIRHAIRNRKLAQENGQNRWNNKILENIGLQNTTQEATIALVLDGFEDVEQEQQSLMRPSLIRPPRHDEGMPSGKQASKQASKPASQPASQQASKKAYVTLLRSMQGLVRKRSHLKNLGFVDLHRVRDGALCPLSLCLPRNMYHIKSVLRNEFFAIHAVLSVSLVMDVPHSTVDDHRSSMCSRREVTRKFGERHVVRET